MASTSRCIHCAIGIPTATHGRGWPPRCQDACEAKLLSPWLPPLTPWPVRAPCVVFAGRLTAEKGVTTLLRAWRLWGTDAPELRLIGDGELRVVLENLARDLPVRFLGQIPGAEAQKQIAGARLLVLPSECFEGFPMVVREAFAFGTPAAAVSHRAATCTSFEMASAAWCSCRGTRILCCARCGRCGTRQPCWRAWVKGRGRNLKPNILRMSITLP